MRSRSTIFAGGAALAATALSLVLVAPANADIAPGADDIVGVGSDTVQNIANFMFDGDYTTLATGVNPTVVKNRVFSFDATPDANDRAGYLNGSTSAVPKPLTPSVVLRAGASPVQRPNGSSAGINALLADRTAPFQINFVRSSRLPSAQNQNDAINLSGFAGGLRVIKISTDALKVASTNTTNAPPSLTVAQLVGIYECTTTNWSAVGGTPGTIIPQIPQSGSGTRNSFQADLSTAKGSPVSLGTCVQTVEENDPASLTGSASPVNTIAPFSEGRNNLYGAGYFKDPTVVFPGAAGPVSSGIKMLGGYANNRGLYIVLRQSDVASTKKWQPGSAQNWAQALFVGPGSYAAGADAAAAIASGGATQTYVDCGNGPTVATC